MSKSLSCFCFVFVFVISVKCAEIFLWYSSNSFTDCFLLRLLITHAHVHNSRWCKISPSNLRFVVHSTISVVTRKHEVRQISHKVVKKITIYFALQHYCVCGFETDHRAESETLECICKFQQLSKGHRI